MTSGIADTAYFGPENEFFVFDDVKFEDTIGSCFFKVDSSEACWNSGKSYEDGKHGPQTRCKRRIFSSTAC